MLRFGSLRLPEQVVEFFDSRHERCLGTGALVKDDEGGDEVPVGPCPLGQDGQGVPDRANQIPVHELPIVAWA